VAGSPTASNPRAGACVTTGRSVWLKSLPRRWRRFAGWGSTRRCDDFTFTTRMSRQCSERYVSSVLRFGAVLTITLTALAFVVGPHLLQRVAPHFAVPFFPYIALAIGTAAANQTVDYRLGLYQSEQRPLAFSLMASASFLMTAGSALLLVVLLRRGAVGMLTGKLMGAAGSLLVAAIVSRKWWAGGFEWKFVRESLPIALPLLPHLLLALGLVVADRFILEYYRNLGEVGVYSVAYTFGMVMYLVTASISQAWSPLFYDVARNGREGQRTLGRLFSGLSLLLVAIAVFGSLIAQDVVSHFLDKRYSSAGRLVPWIIAGYLFHALYGILQPSLLQARRVGFMWVVSGVALVANIGLNFLWIPRWGMYGAAYATMAAYVIEAAMMYVYAASCAVMRGATPVVADIDRDSSNLTAETIESVITPRTKAIVAVHLAGWPCEMDSILELARRRGIAVVEDCPQAHGARYRGQPRFLWRDGCLFLLPGQEHDDRR
jgi:O-antigen/teichoic acid export membrane protein